LLITTLAMGAVLVVTSLLGYLSARDAGAAVVRARGRDLLFLVQRSLMLAGAADSKSLGDIVDDLTPQGLRAISVVERSGQVAASAGSFDGSFGLLPRVSRRSDPLFDIDWTAGRVRVVAPPAFGRGRHHRGRGNRGCGPGCEWMHPGQGAPERLVLEFEPLVAGAMISRAGWTFRASLAAAVLLLLLALVFFRLSRRAELVQSQLERERKLALLGEMSAVLGHELRNPLASLKGHAQLLLEKLPADHPGRVGAETVVREALRLEELTGHVLDFARNGELKHESVNPVELVRAAVDEVGSESVRIEAGEIPDSWLLDRARMQQVLVNLIRNALQASGEDGKVEVSLAFEDGKLVFKVSDSGPGLVAGEESRIFEPFYTRRVKGTGLGLAVARRIVTGHGGDIEARNNQPEAGAQFVVRLPAG